ncbi:MAG TPA: class I SAM-dependent methyltransferase [Terriglobales bacterium]|nr:class I SAM-dependent methyltransferase [Terriglobales bacterium]
MRDTTQAGAITGEITANPNPVSFGQDGVVISWQTNDPGGSEVRVWTSSDEEKLVSKSRSSSGQTKIAWIVDSTTYEFRLYAASQPNAPIDVVEVRRDFASVPAILREIGDQLLRGNIDATELSQFMAKVMRCCMSSKNFRQSFLLWERHGFHVTPVHFYQPIPDTQNLSTTLWDRPRELVGIDMNDSMQLDLLRNHFPKFRDEYERIPIEPTGESNSFYVRNTLFGAADALVTYCMVRHFQPRLIVEVGGGFSTLLLTKAAAKNNATALICVEPFPQEFLKQGVPGLNRLIEKKVQDIDLEFFSQLNSGDILFIDSSHTVKIGGDVNYLFLEVLPRLNPGVIVHIHDIFLPFEYRRDWVVDELRFWTEQYLLQAFLTFNSEFEVLMANSYMGHKYVADVKLAFPTLEKVKTRFINSAKWGGGSFWIRRKPSEETTFAES